MTGVLGCTPALGKPWFAVAAPGELWRVLHLEEAVYPPLSTCGNTMSRNTDYPAHSELY